MQSESGIVPDFEVGEEFQEEPKTYYELKSQPLKNRSVLCPWTVISHRGEAVLMLCRYFNSHGSTLNVVWVWDNHRIPIDVVEVGPSLVQRLSACLSLLTVIPEVMQRCHLGVVLSTLTSNISLLAYYVLVCLEIRSIWKQCCRHPCSPNGPNVWHHLPNLNRFSDHGWWVVSYRLICKTIRPTVAARNSKESRPMTVKGNLTWMHKVFLCI